MPIPGAVLGGEIEVSPWSGRILPRCRPAPDRAPSSGSAATAAPCSASLNARSLVNLDLQVPTELTPEERLHYEAGCSAHTTGLTDRLDIEPGNHEF